MDFFFRMFLFGSQRFKKNMLYPNNSDSPRGLQIIRWPNFLTWLAKMCHPQGGGRNICNRKTTGYAGLKPWLNMYSLPWKDPLWGPLQFIYYFCGMVFGKLFNIFTTRCNSLVGVSPLSLEASFSPQKVFSRHLNFISVWKQAIIPKKWRENFPATKIALNLNFGVAGCLTIKLHVVLLQDWPECCSKNYIVAV